MTYDEWRHWYMEEKVMPISGLPVADYPMELQTRKSYDRQQQRVKKALNEEIDGVPAEERADAKDKRNAAKTKALYAARAAAATTAPPPAAASPDSGAAGSSAVPPVSGVASLGNSTASEELRGTRSQPTTSTRGRSASVCRNKIHGTARAVRSSSPDPGSNRLRHLPESHAPDSGNGGSNASPAGPDARLSNESSADSVLSSPPDASKRTTAELLQMQPPASGDCRLKATMRYTDVRLTHVQPKAKLQTNDDFWRWVDKQRTSETRMLCQLGYNKGLTVPPGRHHWIDAYALRHGCTWDPPRHSTCYVIDVSYEDSGIDVDDSDLHASDWFLPPPWTYRRKP